MKYCGNTTNLASHLKTQHSQLYLKSGLGSAVKKGKASAREQDRPIASGQMTITSALNMATKLPSSSKRAREVTSSINYFIAKDMQPISIVEGAGFQHMLHCLEPRYEVPHRKTFTEKLLPSLYVKEKDAVMSITGAANYYAITTDCWTSRANEAYVGVTFHTVTNDWQLHHCVLTNEELPEQHTAVNLAQTLENVLQEWKLDSTKVSGATVDHAANIQKAVTDILHWTSLGCFGHAINLCVRAGLNHPQVRTAIAHCSRLVTFFRKSAQSSHVLSKKQEALNTPQHKLCRDVVTRWNSTYDMVDRVMEQQTPICATLVEVKRMDLLPKDGEFSLLEAVLKVLKPFKDVTVQISAEKYVTVSAIRPLLHHLIDTVLKVEDSDLAPIKGMKLDMARNLNTRYQESATVELLDLACFIDPRFKTMPFMEEDEKEILYSSVVEEVMMHVTPDPEPVEEEQPTQPSVVDSEPPAKKHKTGLGKLLGGMYSKTSRKERMSIRDKAEEQMKQYCDEPSLDIDENVLQWWKRNESRFPAIARIAKKVLCVPATSTPAERLFSTAGHIINTKRASLSTENVSMLCFLAENLQ